MLPSPSGCSAPRLSGSGTSAPVTAQRHRSRSGSADPLSGGNILTHSKPAARAGMLAGRVRAPRPPAGHAPGRRPGSERPRRGEPAPAPPAGGADPPLPAEARLRQRDRLLWVRARRLRGARRRRPRACGGYRRRRRCSRAGRGRLRAPPLPGRSPRCPRVGAAPLELPGRSGRHIRVVGGEVLEGGHGCGPLSWASWAPVSGAWGAGTRVRPGDGELLPQQEVLHRHLSVAPAGDAQHGEQEHQPLEHPPRMPHARRHSLRTDFWHCEDRPGAPSCVA